MGTTNLVSDLECEGTEVTPTICFKPLDGIFEISGESRPEDAREFYADIIDWLTKYFDTYFSREDLVKMQSGMTLVFKMEYFDSTSAKFFLDIMAMLTEYHKREFDVKIKWYYEEDDTDMRESGEGFAELCDLPFNIIALSDALTIEQTGKTPLVSFKPKENSYLISGKSYPEEGGFFYQPIMEWIDEHGEKYFTPESQFDFKLEYYNTSTSKAILTIFQKLDVFYGKGMQKQINWTVADEDDLDDIELIKEYGTFIKIPIITIGKEHA